MKRPAGTPKESLVFNIVYTPGSVSVLRLFVLSLLKWLDCSFRLVSNACSESESRLLQALCRDHPRLDFIALPNTSPARHGSVLSYLQSLEGSNHFCFMDSDIIATGDFLADLIPHLKGQTNVFSGSPIICREDDQVLPSASPGIHGRYNRTGTGMCLGSTYLAVYDNNALKSVMTSTGIGFENLRWEEVPICLHDWLIRRKLDKKTYDTGKLLNLALLARGASFRFVDSPSLLHLGDISAPLLPLRIRGNRRVDVEVRNARKRINQCAGFFKPNSHGTRTDPHSDEAFGVRQGEFYDQRRCIGRYFARLLRSLFEDRRRPDQPKIGDPAIEARISTATAEVVALYDAYAGTLQG